MLFGELLPYAYSDNSSNSIPFYNYDNFSRIFNTASVLFLELFEEGKILRISKFRFGFNWNFGK